MASRTVCPTTLPGTEAQLTGLSFPHEVHMGPLLQVPLDGIPSLRHIDLTTQLGIICRLAEGALNPSISLLKISNSTGPSLYSLPDPYTSGLQTSPVHDHCSPGCLQSRCHWWALTCIGDHQVQYHTPCGRAVYYLA